jgi:O-antigen/teichoic acid export membrane protein
MIPRLRALGRGSDVGRTLAVALVPVGLIGVAFAGAVYVLAPQLARVFFHGVRVADATAYIHVLAPFLPLGAAATVVLAATRGFGTMRPYVFLQNIVLPALRVVAVGAVVALGLGATAVAWGWCAPLTVALAGGLVVVARRLRRASASSAEPRDARVLASEFWRFVGPRGLAAILGITVTWIPVLLVGALRSTREAGIYAAASRLAIVGAYALQAVGMALAPQISALLARERVDRVELVYQLGTWWLMAFTWPLYLVLAVFAPVVMRMFGAQFVDGAVPLAILSLAMLVNLGTGNVNVVLLMSGRSMWNLINGVGSLVLNLGLNLLLIPPFGITGAAVAWAASIVCVNVAAAIEVHFLVGVRPFGRGYPFVAAGAVLSFGLVAGAVRYSLGPSIPALAAGVAAATCVYAALLWRYRAALRLDGLRTVVPERLSLAGRPS